MRVNILAGGPTEFWPDDLFDQPGTWLGADRGAWYLKEAGIEFDLAVGDFDSLSTAEFADLTAHLTDTDVRRFPPEKDFTDTQLAIKTAADLGADEIKVYGATGGRLDHLLANLTFPAMPGFAEIAERVELVDQQNSVTYLLPGEKAVRQISGMKYLGFMPLGIVDNLKILDAKYTLTQPKSRAIMWSSNEFINELVHLSFETGIIVVTQSKDGGS
ncbi:thiamine diphosphokinase [Fructobacillus ficulneus]|uniref:Thiamine diphosphokinase n=1 Tax=Fructobacillus ficulneus TaxID=157463 RepID=A0A0K8MIS7_9LACO|nr:thiamine diphosphokinase [Fructobacillus ficulneus]GAP00079.1 thiamine pyrophosphokinase [Fructobacillus ficulneus]